MSILSDFEDRMASIVEGLFAGAFRSPVQPVEIAKALAKTADDARAVGVGKVYVPTAYVVALSPADAEHMGSFRDTLSGELATYLVAYAQERGYHLTARPKIAFVIHDDLKLGRFRTSPDTASEPGSAQVQTPVAVTPTPAVPSTPPTPAPSSAELDEAARRAQILASVPQVHVLATVTVSGIHHDVVLQGERVLVGRLAQCDVCLEDANVSREHAAFVPEGAGWAIQDLGSTNGTFVNGARVDRARLHDGDVVRIGVSQLTYHEPKA